MAVVEGRKQARIFPSITYNTNACGEHHTGRVPKRVLEAVPFEEGPGVVLMYLVTIGGRFYALGNLEVSYQAPSWRATNLQPESVVREGCEAAVKVMRSKADEDVIVFPLDYDEMPDRCVISVAVPVTEGATRESIKGRMEQAFAGFANCEGLFLAA